jgi:hypothetical protein
MTYTVKGKIWDETFEITWTDGELTGPNIVVIYMQAVAKRKDVVGPPGGPYTTANHLQDPLSALMICRECMEVLSVSGDVPQVPSVPDDAIV